MVEYVRMPKADYEAACNSIRAKTGKTELIKSGAMSAEIDSITTGGGSSNDVRYVTFRNESTGEEYVKAVATGDDCVDVVAKGLWATPTKESDAQYDYTFYGWGAEDGGAADSTILQNITENKTVYAIYTKTVRYYTVTYYDEDGNTVLNTETLAYGTVPSYTPTKDGYTFSGWTPDISAVISDTSYTAVWMACRDFNADTWAKIASYANAGTAADVYELGATKRFTCSNGTTVLAQIVGFNHDDLADGSGKAGLTLLLRGLNGNGYWHHGGTTTQKNAAWNESYMRTKIYELKAVLPTDLANVIKTVTKTYYDLYNSAYETIDETVFIPAAVEVGHRTLIGEGNTYVGFATSKIIKNAYDSAIGYWTRTKSSSGYVIAIKADGTAVAQTQSSNDGGYVGPVFVCI